MCMFDFVKVKKSWRADPGKSLNDNLFFGAVHFTEVFFAKYRVTRKNNEMDFDDMAADCSIAVYESAKKHIDTWNRDYRLDQYIYYRAWSIVGQWLNTYFSRKQRTPGDRPKLKDNRLTPVEFDVGLDEIESTNYEQGLRYVVWKETPRSYSEAKLSDAAEQYLDYYEDCIELGIDPVAPEDFLTNKTSLGTDLRYLEKILNGKSPSRTANKKCRKPSLDRLKQSSKNSVFGLQLDDLRHFGDFNEERI